MADVHVKTLVRAAEIVGGEEALALKLKVTPSHLALWIRGIEPCPANIFLQAVDIVLERSPQAPRAGTPPSPSEQDGDADDQTL